MSQLYAESGDIEHAIAEFVAAAFSPEEREIAALKARIAKTRPYSRARTVLETKLIQVRTRQLGLEVVK